MCVQQNLAKSHIVIGRTWSTSNITNSTLFLAWQLSVQQKRAILKDNLKNKEESQNDKFCPQIRTRKKYAGYRMTFLDDFEYNPI